MDTPILSTSAELNTELDAVVDGIMEIIDCIDRIREADTLPEIHALAEKGTARFGHMEWLDHIRNADDIAKAHAHAESAAGRFRDMVHRLSPMSTVLQDRANRQRVAS